MKNQFVLAAEGKSPSSSGTLDPFVNGKRDKWERILYHGSLQDNPEYKKIREEAKKAEDMHAKMTVPMAQERPIYGYVRDRAREETAAQYGYVHFILNSAVKDRATITNGNSSGVVVNRSVSQDTVGTMKNNGFMVDNFLRKGYSKEQREEYVKTGKLPSGSVIGKWDYDEAQIFGGIDLRRGDVKEISVPSRSWYHADFSHIKKLAEKYNIKYTTYKRGRED